MEASGTNRVNVADRLRDSARQRPDALAIIEAWGKQRSITFAELDRDADSLARGLIDIGVEPPLAGNTVRMALLVKPSIEFVTLVFALLRSGATMVLVDSGLGAKNIVRCLASTQPHGFVAIPMGHVLRIMKRREFSKAKLNVNVGTSWLPLGLPLAGLAARGEKSRAELPHTAADDPAAIVFTSGSTGPPKGVVYRHETFATQLAEIERMYGLEAGGVDLACFPLFGLFNVALGITTVLPEMDFSRPAAAAPTKLLAAANKYQVTQSFASPAVWDKLSRHCEQTGETISSLRQVFSCGAPVSANVMKRTLAMVHPEAEMHTPYGATESLPVSTIEAQEVLGETQAKTEQGAGVCVGKKVDSIEWRIIKITDDPIATLAETEELPRGEIGELIVRGPQVSREYLGEPEASASGANEKLTHNALAKIVDGDSMWHRMGDVGYLDERGRFWYCGRKSHRVVTAEGTLYTECVEQVCNTAEHVDQAALVGANSRGRILPILVVNGVPLDGDDYCYDEMNSLLENNCQLENVFSWVMYDGPLPTDVRHNAKINRELLAKWAAKRIRHSKIALDESNWRSTGDN